MVDRLDNLDLQAFTGATSRGFGAYGAARRLFVLALRNGLAHFQRHPALWRLTLNGLDEGEIAAVEAQFAKAPPTITVGYPREKSTFPLVTVIEAHEEAEQGYLANLGEQVRPEELALYGDYTAADLRTQVLVQRTTKVLRVQTFARHPDVASFLAGWARYVIAGHLGAFEKAGLQGVTFATGGELAPDLTLLPNELYTHGADWRLSGMAPIAMPFKLPGEVVVHGHFNED